MELGEIIWEELQDIISKDTKEYRESLDRNIHVMDVSLDTMRISDPSITVVTRNEIYKAFINRFNTSNDLRASIAYVKDVGNHNRTIFVADPTYGTYLIGPSLGAIQTKLAPILKELNTSSSNEFTGIDSSTGRSTVNIGHISSNSAQLTSPAEQKLEKLLGASIFSGSTIATRSIINALDELHELHTINTSYVFNRNSVKSKEILNILGEGVIVVAIQSAKRNSALAVVEKRILADITKYLGSESFHKKLLKIKGSNSIEQDITGSIIASIKGIPFTSPHTKKVPNKSSIKVASGRVSTSKIPKVPLRSNQGQFYSLTSLQALINSHLQDVISANMGNEGYPGGQRRTLNYRTGRFAASAQVERLSQSREGMITAFYSYMKNPYQVFEPGHPMGKPATRDPKLLIGKSIREIAATKVGNRLRAVSI